MKFNSKTAQWVFGGIGATILGIIIEQSFCSKKETPQTSFQNNVKENNGGQVVGQVGTQNNYYAGDTSLQRKTMEVFAENERLKEQLEEKSLAKVKGSAAIEEGKKNDGGNVNVTSINQSGGITANQVNVVAKTQRRLDGKKQIELINFITDELKKNGKDKSCCISLLWSSSDDEPYNFALEIIAFLETNGYNVCHKGAFMQGLPIKKVEISFEKNALIIMIGTN